MDGILHTVKAVRLAIGSDHPCPSTVLAGLST